MESTQGRAIEASWILNDFIRDRVGGIRAFEYFDTPKFKQGATEQVLGFYYKIADSFLFLTLGKWIEFYDHYQVLIPPEIRLTAKRLRNELEKRGVREFETRWSAIFGEKHRRPLLPTEIDRLYKKITKGMQGHSLGGLMIRTITA